MEEASCHILTLNDDCLEEILKRLAPRDQLNFALTCQRFQDILVMHSSIKYADFNTDILHGWKSWSKRDFLQIVGPQIKSLLIQGDRSIKCLASYCPNVEKLNVREYYPEEDISMLIQNMKRLRDFKIRRNITDGMIKHFSELIHLKNLGISISDGLTGKYLHLLHDLEKLTIYNYYYSGRIEFQEICANLKNLHYLDVRFTFLEREDFEHISQHLQQLNTIKLTSHGANYRTIAQLPNLKSVEINDVSVNDKTVKGFLSDLGKDKSTQIEELILLFKPDTQIIPLISQFKNLKVLLCSYRAIDVQNMFVSQLNQLEDIFLNSCYSITDQVVLQIIKNSYKLKYLTLQYCRLLTPDCVTSAEKLLKEQRDRCLRSDRLQMTINTDIQCNCDDFINDSDVLQAKCNYNTYFARIKCDYFTE